MSDPNSKEYSVYLWFEDGSYHRELQHVDMVTAVAKATSMCTNVGAQMGITQKVMITDGGDCSIFEWEHGKGIVHPPEEPARGV